jgi:aerobic carbon-monoxide dehydrogenase small subunit
MYAPGQAALPRGPDVMGGDWMDHRMSIALVVNGRQERISAEPRTLLVHALRDDLGLTGTHVGCDTSQCGACTVLVEGRAVKACTMLAAQAEGRDVRTVEGLAELAPPGMRMDGMHPLQHAFRSQHGLQCGFCTPGMLMLATDLLARTPDPSEADVRDALEGNLCRCTGYQNIVAAVLEAAAAMRRAAAVERPGRAVGGEA